MDLNVYIEDYWGWLHEKETLEKHWTPCQNCTQAASNSAEHRHYCLGSNGVSYVINKKLKLYVNQYHQSIVSQLLCMDNACH